MTQKERIEKRDKIIEVLNRLKVLYEVLEPISTTDIDKASQDLYELADNLGRPIRQKDEPCNDNEWVHIQYLKDSLHRIKDAVKKLFEQEEGYYSFSHCANWLKHEWKCEKVAYQNEQRKQNTPLNEKSGMPYKVGDLIFIHEIKNNELYGTDYYVGIKTRIKKIDEDGTIHTEDGYAVNANYGDVFEEVERER